MYIPRAFFGQPGNFQTENTSFPHFRFVSKYGLPQRYRSLNIAAINDQYHFRALGVKNYSVYSSVNYQLGKYMKAERQLVLIHINGQALMHNILLGLSAKRHFVHDKHLNQLRLILFHQ